MDCNSRNCSASFTRSVCEAQEHFHDESLWDCLVCKKSFSSNSLLRKHELLHYKKKPFPCDICKAVFRTKLDLLHHKVNHTKDRRLKCDICHSAFECKAYLLRHKRIHSDERPFKCIHCAQVFKTRMSYKEHVKTHFVRQYHICICGKTFATKNDLARHRIVHKREFSNTFINQKYIKGKFASSAHRTL